MITYVVTIKFRLGQNNVKLLFRTSIIKYVGITKTTPLLTNVFTMHLY